MTSCPLCHAQHPKPAKKVSVSTLQSWSLAANTHLLIAQRICLKHFDNNNLPTLQLPKKHAQGGTLDGAYWKLDNKRGKYNITNKPLTHKQHTTHLAALTNTITTHKTTHLNHHPYHLSLLQN
jgi:hypothetical protein